MIRVLTGILGRLNSHREPSYRLSMPIQNFLALDKIKSLSNPYWYHSIDFVDYLTPGHNWHKLWEWIAKFISDNNRIFQGADILEFGPQDGLWTAWMTKLGCRHISSVDILNKPEFRLVCEAFDLPVEYYPSVTSSDTPRHVKKDFSGVASLGVLYHLHDPLAALMMYRRFLRKGGWLLLETAAVKGKTRAMYYTENGPLSGRSSGNIFYPTEGFLENALTEGLGFQIVDQKFLVTGFSPAIRRLTGRLILLAYVQTPPNIANFEFVTEGLGFKAPFEG